MKPVRILVADDHEVVRRGLRAILETREGWEVTGEAATGREAVEQAKQLKPDVVVLDLVMPEMNGLEATRRILKAVPTAEVLILTMHEPEHLMHEVLTAGARGYLLKSDAGRELVAAVDALSRHVPAFTSRVANALLEAYLKNDGHELGADRRQGRLTPREREIVQLLAEGKTNCRAGYRRQDRRGPPLERHAQAGPAFAERDRSLCRPQQDRPRVVSRLTRAWCLRGSFVGPSCRCTRHQRWWRHRPTTPPLPT